MLVGLTSALGHKQTFAVQNGMSALHPIADICGAARDVRYGPKADMATSLSYWFAFLVCASAYRKRRALLSRRLLRRLRCRQRRYQPRHQRGLQLCFLRGPPWLAPCCAPPTTPCALAMTGKARAMRSPPRINVAFICILQSKNKQADRTLWV